MPCEIIALGKAGEYPEKMCAEYIKRLPGRLSVCELKERRIFGDNIEKALSEEAEDIASRLKKDDMLIAMCVEGKSISSEELADIIKEAEQSGKRPVFVIGSSFGLSDEIKKRAKYKISVSAMTFPHGIFRLMLCEQIYRAYTIIDNKKYHK